MAEYISDASILDIKKKWKARRRLHMELPNAKLMDEQGENSSRS